MKPAKVNYDWQIPWSCGAYGKISHSGVNEFGSSLYGCIFHP